MGLRFIGNFQCGTGFERHPPPLMLIAEHGHLGQGCEPDASRGEVVVNRGAVQDELRVNERAS